MPPITVNWSDLEIAFERNSPDQESFLDLENGDLLSIVDRDQEALAQRRDGGLVIAANEGAAAVGDLAGALGAQDDERETVGDLLETIFDGDAGHWNETP